MNLRFHLEYAGARVIEQALRRLSWERTQSLGAAAGGAARFMLRRRWAMTLKNIEASFPEKTIEECHAIALSAWRNAGSTAAEFTKSRHLTREELGRLITYENLDLARSLLREGKGIILNLAHMGNWELGGIDFAARGFPVAAIVRSMKSPVAEKWVKETRSHFGLALFSHRNPFFPALKWLKQGKILAILIDHNLYEGGVFVPFLGRLAATSTISALLAVRAGCPILSTSVQREGSGFRIRFDGPLRHDPSADPEKEIARLTLEMIKTLENYVRERPGEWLWGHNRWKRQP